MKFRCFLGECLWNDAPCGQQASMSLKRRFSLFWGTIWDNFWCLWDHFGDPGAFPGRLWASSETRVEMLTIFDRFWGPIWGLSVSLFCTFVTPCVKNVISGGNFHCLRHVFSQSPCLDRFFVDFYVAEKGEIKQNHNRVVQNQGFAFFRKDRIGEQL